MMKVGDRVRLNKLGRAIEFYFHEIDGLIVNGDSRSLSVSVAWTGLGQHGTYAMNPDHLEVIPDPRDQQIAMLTAQRDTLLAACRESVAELQALGIEHGRAIEALEDAIALCDAATGREASDA